MYELYIITIMCVSYSHNIFAWANNTSNTIITINIPHSNIVISTTNQVDRPSYVCFKKKYSLSRLIYVYKCSLLLDMAGCVLNQSLLLICVTWDVSVRGLDITYTYIYRQIVIVLLFLYCWFVWQLWMISKNLYGILNVTISNFRVFLCVTSVSYIRNFFLLNSCHIIRFNGIWINKFICEKYVIDMSYMHVFLCSGLFFIVGPCKISVDLWGFINKPLHWSWDGGSCLYLYANVAVIEHYCIYNYCCYVWGRMLSLITDNRMT